MRHIVLALGLAAGALLASAASARPLVAVIDSGVAATAELKPNLIAEYDMAGSRPAFAPRYDHGTMIATIIARESRGAIDLVSLRIDDPAGCAPSLTPPCQPSAAPIVAAIRKAVELKVDAINISLTLKDDPAIVAAIHEAATKGVLIVLAAGNEGRDHPGNLGMALAGAPNSVLVGALDAGGQPWKGTNRPGPEPAKSYEYVWRLGVDVPASLIDGSAATGTGTSFAAPIETARRVMARAKVTTASAS